MAGRGRYQVYVRGSAAPQTSVHPEWANAIRNSGMENTPLPRVSSVAARGLKFSSGGDTFAAMRGPAGAADGGGIPVSMTMAQAKKANARGLLASGRGNAGADRLSLDPAAIWITVDFSDMKRLGNSIASIGTVIKQGNSVIAKAINEGMRRFEAGVKRDLVQWTGIKSKERVGRGFTRTYASAATMTARMRVRDRHIRVTAEYFGASWGGKSTPGGTHAAWNNPQLARHTFMIPGAKPLFKRMGRGRRPIVPLWGPNVVREIERHEGEVQARLAIVNLNVQQTAVRLMRMAIARAR